MRSRRAGALAVGAVALVTLTACGSSSGSSSSAGASSAAPSSGSSTMQRFPGVTGTIAAVSSGTLQVQNPQSGQTAVTYTSSTPVTATVSATRAALVTGKCATVIGSGATQTVTISTPQNGSCTRGFGGRFAGGAGGTGGGTRTPRARPSGAPNGRFSGASGTVSSVTPTSFVVTRSNANGGNTTSTVTTTATTVYTQTTTATDSALRVGQCLTAVGKTGDTGAVAATSLSVRAPGPQGCTTGFRGAGTGTAGGSTGGSQ